MCRGLNCWCRAAASGRARLAGDAALAQPRLGSPGLVDFIERLAHEARGDGWPDLLVGDMRPPRGGPMCSGHASHQMGLDVDLWLIPAPHPGLSAAEREELSAVSMLRPGVREVDPARFGPGQAAPIHRAAQSPQVERVFIHPTLKQALCAGVGGDRAWLAKVRPRWGRDEPFHVRLACPPDQPDCHAHKAPPPGDGCGAELAWWLSDEPWKPEAIGPSKPLRMADMPSACQAVLVAP